MSLIKYLNYNSKKIILFSLIFLICFLFTSCQSKEEQANKLALEADTFIESNELNSALLKYTEANNIFPSDEYSFF